MNKLIKNILIVGALALPSYSLAEGLTINPNTGDTSVRNFLMNTVLDNLLNFGGVLAIVFVLISGVKMVTSSGNADRLGNAKKTLTYAIGGLLLVLLAKVIFYVLTNSIFPSIFKGGVAPY